MNDAMGLLLQRTSFDFSAAAEKEFAGALIAELRHHQQSCPQASNLFAAKQFDPGSLTIAGLKDLPFFHVEVFKKHDLSSIPEEQVKITLTSSGTSGRKSKIILDDVSLARIKKIAFQVHADLGLARPPGQANYVMFSYDPQYARDVGTAFSDELTSLLTPRKQAHYAFAWDQARGEFYFDLPGTAKAIKKFSEQELPVRLLGFPAFIARAMKAFRDYFGRVELPAKSDSFVLTGGGWKTLESEKMGPAEFRNLIVETLGIPDENIRDCYGFVEHGVPYVECRLHKLHIPNVARVIARDPMTLQALAYGREGLLHFITPYIHSYPAVSVLSSDFGIVHERCRCGIAGPYLEVTGRAGKTKHKGCAFKAEEMTK